MTTSEREPMSPQAVCAKAAELIRRDGWVQGSIGGPSRGYCLVGALSYAGARDELCFAAERLVKKRLGLGGPVTSAWNDDPSRTVDEVLAVLDEAASQTEVTG